MAPGRKILFFIGFGERHWGRPISIQGSGGAVEFPNCAEVVPRVGWCAKILGALRVETCWPRGPCVLRHF